MSGVLRMVRVSLILSPLAGCDLTEAVCTTEARPAIQVEVLDSVAGTRLDAPLAWVQDRAYRDTLMVFQGVAFGASERAGTCDVHVEHSGYAPWVLTGVRVTEGAWHVNTRELTARLQLLP